MFKMMMTSFIAMSFSAVSSASVSFSCFEAMADIYSKSKVETKELSAKEEAIVKAATTDALKRASEKASMISKTPEVRILRAYGDKISGLNIVTSNDPEYGSYFLYSYSDYSKELEILSEHIGDDQGPELNLLCSGWTEGSLVKKF